MNQISAPELEDKFITVDGLKIRYIEAGDGPAVLLLHGGSLGSSADVFRRNIPPLANGGLRAIAFDQPGFGITDLPTDFTTPYRRAMIPKFMDALGLKKAGLFAHSQAGGMAVQLALADPQRYSHVMILGTGSLLPPLPESDADISEVPQRRDPSKPPSMPTLETTRRLLESQLYHHDMITDAELQLRYKHTIGQAFEAHVERWKLSNSATSNKAAAGKSADKPLWQRLTELKMPLLMLYGREDRAEAAARAEYLKKLHPEINLHIVDHCKHLVPWDAADKAVELAVPFFKS